MSNASKYLQLYQYSYNSLMCTESGPGHLISVGMVFSLPAAPGPGGCAPKGLVKQKMRTKMANIILEKITCTNFIKAFLSTHSLSNKYSPGVHSGPDFKLWWSGSPYILFVNSSKLSHHVPAVAASPGQQLSRWTMIFTSL